MDQFNIRLAAFLELSIECVLSFSLPSGSSWYSAHAWNVAVRCDKLSNGEELIIHLKTMGDCGVSLTHVRPSLRPISKRRVHLAPAAFEAEAQPKTSQVCTHYLAMTKCAYVFDYEGCFLKNGDSRLKRLTFDIMVIWYAIVRPKWTPTFVHDRSSAQSHVYRFAQD